MSEVQIPTNAEIANMDTQNGNFWKAYKKHERSENKFKYNISMAMMDAGIRGFSWEKRIAHVPSDGTTIPWSIFADLYTYPEKDWVIECKIKADVSSCAKALGQALIYRQLVGFKKAIVCFPMHEICTREFSGEFEMVCKSHGVLLANETNIVEVIKSL